MIPQFEIANPLWSQSKAEVYYKHAQGDHACRELEQLKLMMGTAHCDGLHRARVSREP